MGAAYNWLVEGHIIEIRYNDILTIEDLDKIITWAMARAADRKGTFIHTIIDNTQVEKYDFRLRDLKKLMSSVTGMEHSGYVVIVTTPKSLIAPMVNFTTSVIMRLLGQRFKILNSWEDAIAFLLEVDTELESVLKPEILKKKLV